MGGSYPKTHVDVRGRVCTKCLTYKTWDFYYKRVRKGGGPKFYLSTCIECTKRQVAPTNTLRRQRLKLETLARYGGYCACCGETEPTFLTIDHIDGNGRQHRRETGTESGADFYWWLRRNNYPAGFQVLCWNCNCARHIKGTCPHALALTGLKEAG